MRVFIGPQEVAGYYRNLAKGFQQLGVKYDFIVYYTHNFRYGGESSQPFLFTVFSRLRKYRDKNRQWKVISIFLGLLTRLSLVVWFLYTLYRYDVFIFSFGQSILPRNWDLPLLRLFGKRVISYLGHGAESRPSFIDGAYQSFVGKPIPLKALYDKNIKNYKLVRFHQKYANVVIGAPLSTSHFAKKKFINSFFIGTPFHSYGLIESVNEFENKYSEKRPIRILHSPSHPAVKGSLIIEQAIDNLKKKGYTIDFILVHGRPFSEVLNEIQKCDFVIDQIYSDTPMAGFATESAWFGKPAIVGGYGWGVLKNFVNSDLWPPSLICHPDNISDAIEEFLAYPQKRIDLGKKAQEFVQKKWNSVVVAKRFLRLINNEIPDEWWINPNDVQYLKGAGQSEERTKQNIQELVKKYGTKALQLSHRQDLESAFLEFAQIETLVD